MAENSSLLHDNPFNYTDSDSDNMRNYESTKNTDEYILEATKEKSLKQNTKVHTSRGRNDEFGIPSWDVLNEIYEKKWETEKEKFQTALKQNFHSLVQRFASGKQEIYVLCAPDRREKHYIRAFLELFESGYAPHIGDVERLAGKKVRKLYITLPHNYHD